MKINHNMAATITNNQLLRTENNLSQVMERLSSGLKINHAKDDAAGMAISSKMKTQANGLSQASRNASDGTSVIETADGALNEVVNIIQRMRELSVQAANGTNTWDDRKSVQDEIDSLKEEIDRISKDTEFNSKTLLDGNLANRVYASKSDVSRIQASDEVPKGKYEVTISEKAEQAIINTAVPASASNVLDKDYTLSINDVSIQFKKGDSADTFYEKLRDGAETAGVTVSKDATGKYSFKSEEYGAAAEIKIASKDAAFVKDYIGIDLPQNNNKVLPYTAIGKDVKVDLTRKTANREDGFADTATVTTDGKRVTITDRNGFELSFYSDVEKDDKITFDVTKMGAMTLQVGARENQTMDMTIPDLSTESLYIDKVNVAKAKGADRALVSLDEALANVSSVRSKLGAYENRLDSTVASLDQSNENLESAISRISDADMAQEMTEYTKQNVLSQAATSVLAQANDIPQQVLQLLH